MTGAASAGVGAAGLGAGRYLAASARPDTTVTSVHELTTQDGTSRYTVRAVHSYHKAQLPRDVFDRGGEPRQVLISCGGSFDASTHQYSDNIVVYGTPES